MYIIPLFGSKIYHVIFIRMKHGQSLAHVIAHLKRHKHDD